MHLFFVSIIIPESHDGFVFVDEKENNSNNKKSMPRQGGINWIPALQIFSEVSTWIFMPIILALIAGKALDRHFGTKPTLLLVSAGVAFLISAYGIVKSVKKYAKKIKDKNL